MTLLSTSIRQWADGNKGQLMACEYDLRVHMFATAFREEAEGAGHDTSAISQESILGWCSRLLVVYDELVEAGHEEVGLIRAVGVLAKRDELIRIALVDYSEIVLADYSGSE